LANGNIPPEGIPKVDVVVGLVKLYDPESYAGRSLLLVGSSMPDSSNEMTQTKRDALILQFGRW